MPVSSSTFPAAAAVVPHPVDDIADQHAALRRVRLGEHPWPQQSQVIRRNHDGNAASGSSP
jgi:hypothetical protein